MRTKSEAEAAGLPTFDEVLQNSDRGFASLVSMLTAWRLGREAGVISAPEFSEVVINQRQLLDDLIAQCRDPQAFASLRQLRAEYDAEPAPPTLAELLKSAKGFDGSRKPRAAVHR
jgi:hypothetical protein